MRWLLLPLVLVLTTATSLAQDAPPKPHDPARARELADSARAALESGNAASAVELYARAREHAPESDALLHNLALALQRAGKQADARAAFEGLLESEDEDLRCRAQLGLGMQDLRGAWGSYELLRTDEADLAEKVQEQLKAQLPAGTRLDEKQVQEAVDSVRRDAAEQGLEQAEDAAERLRDLVRADPGDEDAVRNLVLAQRARRLMETVLEAQPPPPEEQEQDPQKPDEQPQDGEQQEQEQEQQQGEQEGSQPEQQEQEQQSEGGEEQQEGEPEDEQEGAEGQESESDQQEQEGEKEGEAQERDISREEAERKLEKLLEQAAKRARDVRERREAELRRGPVEKDW